MRLFTANGVTIAKCVKVNEKGWFFAQNGDPEQIFCHVNQGGVLSVTETGNLTIEYAGSLPVANINQEIVLIREDENPGGEHYTRARLWTTKPEWDAHKWAFRGGARVTYRAIAHSHRTKGKFQSTTNNQVELLSDRLIEIMRKHPRTGDNTTDILMSGYYTSFNGNKISHQVRWERLDSDGTWTKCGEPRPLANTIPKIGSSN